ncbi:glycine betaine ABC transporter substrate-binding protein [Marinilabilia rubra]|uniref:Glycine/betaine ABC transporter n=1 Tax=Marinilabilia rubra TaxID=2162893 RepID=A0A2U2BCE7_9BACT|nr:glycine betaine ABC transporter substrate-binding protein [Marinilabilia rubra]PWE00739.1 glycine/betaine ABC transporter [Marinilabilia rubra]
MKKRNCRNSITVFAALAFMLISGCNKKKEEVTLYYANWAETVAMTKITELALEDVGIPAKSMLLSPGPVFTALAQGDGDIFLEAWLPQTHAHYWERFGDKIDKVGVCLDYASTGLVVPKYVEIDSITQLNEYKEKFNGEIVGIGSGSGVYKDTEHAIEAYGLEFDQLTSSGPAMVASIKNAAAREKWIVVTGWKPHYKWAKYDLKYLKDPKGIYPSEKGYIVTRQGFTDERPGFKKFLGNFYFNEKQMSELMLLFEEENNDDAAAKKWYKENKDLIQSWMPEEWLK